MTGMILWRTPQNRKRWKTVTLEERSVLHMRLLCAEVARTPKTSPAALRRRLSRACGVMKKLGVTQLVLPEDLPGGKPPDTRGLPGVSTLSLRRALAAEWTRQGLARRGLAGGTVAVTTRQLSAEVVRTVTELCLHHRYVLLEADYGAEALCRQLRREYGVSLMLQPSKEQLNAAAAVLLFCRRGDTLRNPLVLPLYDESVQLPALRLPPAMEEQLPAGANRGQLLCALLEAGALRPGQITVDGRCGAGEDAAQA